MYIKVNNSSQVINMDDYVLINDLAFHLRKINLSSLKDGDNYYTKDEVQELVKGQLDVDSFVTENNLIDILKSYVTGFTMFYMQTDDAENEPDVNDASWAESITNWLPNKYMWQMVEINKPGLIVRSTPVCISGPAGEEEEEEVINRLIEVRPQWCLNNDGNWNYELMNLPTEFDEVWMRNELIWDDGFTTNTEPVKDQIFEKVKELINRVTTLEEEMTKKMEREDFDKYISLPESNLLENGDFFDGIDNESWQSYTSGINHPRVQYKKGEYPSFRAVVFQGEESEVQQIRQLVTPMVNKENMEYTLSCMVQCDANYDGYSDPFYGLMVKIDYADTDADIDAEFRTAITDTTGEWHKLMLTFTIDKPVKTIDCYFCVHDTTKIIRVSEMMLMPGNLDIAFRSNMEEIKNKITPEDVIEDLQSQIEDLRAMIEDLQNRL